MITQVAKEFLGMLFNDDDEQELYFMVQMPHSWVEGTDIDR